MRLCFEISAGEIGLWVWSPIFFYASIVGKVDSPNELSSGADLSLASASFHDLAYRSSAHYAKVVLAAWLQRKIAESSLAMDWLSLDSIKRQLTASGCERRSFYYLHDSVKCVNASVRATLTFADMQFSRVNANSLYKEEVHPDSGLLIYAFCITRRL